MRQNHHLVPPLGAAVIALLPLALLGAGVPASPHSSAGRPSSPDGARGAMVARLTRGRLEPPSAAAPAAAVAPKGSASTPAAPLGGAYPYPLDAMGEVASGRLAVEASAAGPAGQERLTVQIPSGGWVPGQKVFLYLGRQFLLEVSPGGSAVIDTAGSAGLTLSGFQFPADDPAAPVDGYGADPVPGAP